MLLVSGIILSILMFILGSMIFSFLNVVIYRMPRGENFIKGRSRCTSCGHVLSFSDMMPIISIIRLGGRCRYCKAPVSKRYSVVEALGGAAAVLSFLLHGFSLQGILAFAMCCVITCVGFIDHDTMIIPDSLCIIAAIIGVLAMIFTDASPWYSHLAGAFIVSVPLFIIAFFVPGAFGGGDIKLMAACGLYLGFADVIFAFFVGTVVGGLYAVHLLMTNKKGRKDHLAFGPWLCIGVAAAIFVGDLIIDFYITSMLSM